MLFSLKKTPPIPRDLLLVLAAGGTLGLETLLRKKNWFQGSFAFIAVTLLLSVYSKMVKRAMFRKKANWKSTPGFVTNTWPTTEQISGGATKLKGGCAKRKESSHQAASSSQLLLEEVE